MADARRYRETVVRLRRLFPHVRRVCRACALPLLSCVLGCAFLLAPQGQELLRAFAGQDLIGRRLGGSTPGQFAWFIATWTAWAALAGYCAIQLLERRAIAETAAPDHQTISRWFPAVCVSTCALSVPWAYVTANHYEFRMPGSYSLPVAWMQLAGLQFATLLFVIGISSARARWARRLGLIAFLLAAIGALGVIPLIRLGESGGPVLAGMAGAFFGVSLLIQYVAGRWFRRAALALLAASLWLLWAVRDPGNPWIPGLLATISVVLPCAFVFLQRRYDVTRFRPAAFVASLAAIGCLVVLFDRRPVDAGLRIGAPAVVLLGLAAWSTAASLALAARRGVNGSLAAVMLALLALGSSPFNDNHVLRHVTYRSADTRDSIADHLAKWRDANRLTDSEPILVVAASGGGLRAAFWTAALLAYSDEQTCGAFSRHVFAISAVSGGSVGAAAYVSLLADVRDHSPDSGCWPHGALPGTSAGALDSMTAFFSADFLGPAAASLLFPDLAQRLLPRPIFRDRAFALEATFERRWRDTFGTDRFASPFLSLYDGRATVPSLVLNATTVDEGTRAIASNLRFQPQEGFDLFAPGLNVEGMRLSTAAHNSARFTFVSPAGTVEKPGTGGPATPWGRLVDGGYFENSGATSLTEIVNAIADAQGGRRTNIYAIVIANDPSARSGCNGGTGTPLAAVKTPVRAYLSETLSPVRTMLAAREARGRFAERELATAVGGCDHTLDWSYGDRFDYSQDAVFYRRMTVTENEPPLAWFLSSDGRASLLRDAWSMAQRLPFCVQEFDESGRDVGPLDQPNPTPCRVILRQPRSTPKGPRGVKH